MLIAVGTKVRLKNTGDKGVISESLGGDLFTVYIEEDDIEIPAFASNLERIDDRKKHTAHVIKGKTPEKRPAPPVPELQYKILSHQGIMLCFVPDYFLDGTTSHFDVVLINDTVSDVLFDVKLNLKHGQKFVVKAKLVSGSTQTLGQLQYGELNALPEVRIDCWECTDKGTGSKLSHHLKIKPKTFFSKITTAPLVNEQAHLFPIFKTLKAKAEKPKQGEDLATYTQRKAVPIRKSQRNYYDYYDVKAFAEFNTELDLHIEQISPDYEGKSNADILNIQLQHFEKYLNRAIELGVERVFIIHGLGKGKLKNEVAARLMLNPEVQTYKNEFHPRYGWGATEVILK